MHLDPILMATFNVSPPSGPFGHCTVVMECLPQGSWLGPISDHLPCLLSTWLFLKTLGVGRLIAVNKYWLLLLSFLLLSLIFFFLVISFYSCYTLVFASLIFLKNEKGEILMLKNGKVITG